MTDAREDGKAAAVGVERDLVYLEAGRAERLDLYRPGVRAGLLPAVVVLHGGGWQGGDKADGRERGVATELAGAGYACASVNYRLAAPDRSAWPGCLHDCKNAVRFLRSRAAQYGIDPERIGVIGFSAGAHLAAMTALTPGAARLEPVAPYPDVSSRVQAAVLMYGVYDFETWQPVEADGTPHVFLRSLAGSLVGGSLAEAPELWREASPVRHVRAGGPPLLLIHGTEDDAVDPGQTAELAAELAAAGAPHEVHIVQGAGHSFDFHPPGAVSVHGVRLSVLGFRRSFRPPAALPPCGATSCADAAGVRTREDRTPNTDNRERLPGADLAPRVIRFFDAHLKGR